MNEIKMFKNESFGEVRTIERNGEAWFIGKDVAAVLGYSDTADALKKHVDAEDKVLLKQGEMPTLKMSNFGAYIINESGLYSLVLSSKLPTAKQFKRWVTTEVIPSIRKTGGYFATPKTYVEALRALADAEEEKERLALENNEMKPKAEFYDDVTGSSDTIEIGKVAKVINCGIGRNKLFEFLRNEKVLMQNNIPFQRFVDEGYFRVIETKYAKPNGDVSINLKTVVYQKGVNYIRKLLKKKGYSK